MKKDIRIEFVIIYLFIFISQDVNAQELTPRAYWPAPYGTKIALLGYKYSFGDILTDPSLPFSGVDSKIHFPRWLHSLLFGNAASN